MTHKEREYLEKIVDDALRSSDEIEKGNLFEKCFSNNEERIKFIQGLHYALDPLRMFMGK